MWMENIVNLGMIENVCNYLNKESIFCLSTTYACLMNLLYLWQECVSLSTY